METLKRRHYYQRDAIKDHHDTYEREEPFYDKLQKPSNNQVPKNIERDKFITLMICTMLATFIPIIQQAHHHDNTTYDCIIWYSLLCY
jgi:hypothetical protein